MEKDFNNNIRNDDKLTRFKGSYPILVKHDVYFQDVPFENNSLKVSFKEALATTTSKMQKAY